MARLRPVRATPSPFPCDVDTLVDSGHDDAVAILMALHLPEIDLLGISTVHGNASLYNTTRNAARCLLAFGSPEQAKRIPVYAGAEKPLLRYVRHDSGLSRLSRRLRSRSPASLPAEIHGEDGLGGVEGLPAADSSAVLAKLDETRGKNAVVALADIARSLPDGEQLTVVATGSFTNIALFVSLYPELVRDKIEKIVVMGGAEGRGNRSPTGELAFLL